MDETFRKFCKEDFLFLINTLMPGYRDKEKMIRILRDDEDILLGMITDEKLFRHLIEDPESIIKISPYLFFTVLLYRVKKELETKPYTIELDERQKMAVFDTRRILNLLNEPKMLSYLTDMLVSFIRINSFSILIKLKKGIWERFRFSDFDISSLIKYCQMIDEEERFHSYKRIADICLFITGIFPDYIDQQYRRIAKKYDQLEIALKMSREGFTRHGTYFYQAAAKHRMAQIKELEKVLQTLSENFTLATKPLNFMSDRYLGFLRERFFLQ